MSIQSVSVANEEEETGFEQLAQNPPAPPDELFDIATTVDPSYIISLIRKLLPPTMNATSDYERVTGSDCATQGSNDVGSYDKISENKCENMDNDSNDQENHLDPTVGNDSWEEHGCILWDLATNKTHAEFMVQNLVLEVILATLMVSKSPRVTEISLGILGNLACHEVSRKQIAKLKGLVEIIVDQLFVDDTPSLCEEFRLLNLCIQGSEGITWAHALQPENVLSRILWIVENTLNPQLIEKSVGFLLAITESEDEVRSVLLSHLVKLGLPTILINLLAFEISKLEGDERLPERYSVLDTILQAIESLSVIDSCSQELCSSKKLFDLLGSLIKLGDKFEVSNSCVTAAVLIANLLSDSNDLIFEINQDLVFLQGILDIFPLASDDIQARNALWDIISRLLSQSQQSETNPKILYQIISVLSSKSDLIEEELLDNQLTSSNNDQTASDRNLLIRTAALRKVDWISSQWLTLKDQVNPTNEYMVNERDLDRLKDCCSKYSKK